MAALKARLASGNRHKLDELRAALPGWELELLATGPRLPARGRGDLLRERARESRVRA